MRASEKVSTMVFAFDAHDSRRQSVRELADEVERLERALASAEELLEHEKRARIEAEELYLAERRARDEVGRWYQEAVDKIRDLETKLATLENKSTQPC